MIVQNGLGSNVPNSSIISSGVSVTGGSLAAAASMGLLTSIGITASMVPFIGPIVGGIALAVVALGIGNGCGPTCTASTAVVNTIEPYMKQNVAAAQAQASANGGCLTSEEVTALTGTFNSLWQYVTDNCSKVGGAGGKQCIEDRQRGGKWDWFSYYLDPILAFPVCAPISASSLMDSLTSNLTGSGTNWFLLGGLGILGIGLLSLAGGKD